MGESFSSKRWLARQSKDTFVKSAKQQGYRARSAFKLLELNQRYKLLQNAQRVIDLGSAPGAWSQVIAERAKMPNATLIALDLLPMASINGVEFIQGDFNEAATVHKIEALIASDALDLVVSDMAPNMTGIKSVDNDRAMLLAELTLDFAQQHLRIGGHLVCKIFQGSGFDQLIRQSRQHFSKVSTFKPQSSRKESREMYLVALLRKAK